MLVLVEEGLCTIAFAPGMKKGAQHMSETEHHECAAAREQHAVPQRDWRVGWPEQPHTYRYRCQRAVANALAATVQTLHKLRGSGRHRQGVPSQTTTRQRRRNQPRDWSTTQLLKVQAVVTCCC